MRKIPHTINANLNAKFDTPNPMAAREISKAATIMTNSIARL
jgi:hypothetical protein